jgi:DNA-binding transcriptional ArsR family regulator
VAGDVNETAAAVRTSTRNASVDSGTPVAGDDATQNATATVENATAGVNETVETAARNATATVEESVTGVDRLATRTESAVTESTDAVNSSVAVANESLQAVSFTGVTATADVNRSVEPPDSTVDVVENATSTVAGDVPGVENATANTVDATTDAVDATTDTARSTAVVDATAPLSAGRAAGNAASATVEGTTDLTATELPDGAAAGTRESAAATTVVSGASQVTDELRRSGRSVAGTTTVSDGRSVTDAGVPSPSDRLDRLVRTADATPAASSAETPADATGRASAVEETSGIPTVAPAGDRTGAAPADRTATVPADDPAAEPATAAESRYGAASTPSNDPDEARDASAPASQIAAEDSGEAARATPSRGSPMEPPSQPSGPGGVPVFPDGLRGAVTAAAAALITVVSGMSTVQASNVAVMVAGATPVRPFPPGPTAGAVRARAARLDPRRWLPLPGYSRYDDSDPLEHDTRQVIYGYVAENPGAHQERVADATGTPTSTVRYHVRILEEEDLVESERCMGKRRLYLATEADRALAAALADDAARAVVETVQRHEPASTSEVADAADRAPSTVSRHLSRLEDAGVVVRERDGMAVLARLSPEARSAYADSRVTVADDGEPAAPASAGGDD